MRRSPRWPRRRSATTRRSICIWSKRSSKRSMLGGGGGGTALDYLDRFGLLGPKLTLGHGVWLNESDIERVAATGTCICHNCSSNFRLRSGIAPLNAFEAHGINTAIGLDEAGINDDRDMLQEMRMVLRTHRVPGMDAGWRPRHGAGAAHGNPRRSSHDVLWRDDRHAREGKSRRSVLDRLEPDRLSLSRRRDADPRCRCTARQNNRRNVCDV